MKKKIRKIFWKLTLVAAVMIELSFVLEMWEYSYLLFWASVVLFFIGIVGSICTHSFKNLCEIWKNINW